MGQGSPGGWPDPPAHLHMLGICGYAVSGLALALVGLGFRVTGADEDAYPPTTDILRSAGVEFADFHSRSNLERWGRPDLVVLGNQVQAGNPELAAALGQDLPVVSEAEAQGMLAADRRRAVVCGTHGKTTTASLCAWMLEGAGLEPGFRLGSTSRDFGATVRLGDLRTPFVFEGDEYTTSALDHRAKFLHWSPEVVTLLNLELDHPDIYPDLDAYRAPYQELLSGMPESGLLLVNGEDQGATELAESCPAVVQRWALETGDWHLSAAVAVEGRSQLLEVVGPAEVRVSLRLPMLGRHNASNALGALATAVALGARPELAADAAADYQGAARRFEVLGQTDGVTVVDDYAHHPTKLRATIAAARQWVGSEQQLILVHVPHTYSRTLALLPEYRDAFQGADLVVLGPIEPARERNLEGSVSSQDVAAAAQGTELVLVGSAEEAIEVVKQRLIRPSLVVCSSVRGFDQVASRLLAALA